MKKHWILLVLALTIAIGSASARTRDDRRGPRPQRPTSPRKCLKQVELTEAQIEAIAVIRHDAMAALREAASPDEARQIVAQMHADTLAVLDDDQLAIYNECMQPERPVTCMEQIDLTEEQLATMDGIRKAAKLALREAQTAEEACAIIERMHQAIEDVLTDEQLAQLRECLRPKEHINCMDRIDLTDEQIAEMDEIRAACMELMETTDTREGIRKVMDMMRQDLMEVLTGEQAAALQQCRDHQRDRPQISR